MPAIHIRGGSSGLWYLLHGLMLHYLTSEGLAPLVWTDLRCVQLPRTGRLPSRP